MKTLAKRIKDERDSKEWSESELARRAGIRQSFIGALETKGQQNSKFLPEIAHALGVDAYWLKTGKGSKYGVGRKLTDFEKLILDAIPFVSTETIDLWTYVATRALEHQKESVA